MSVTTVTIQYNVKEPKGDPFVGNTKTTRRRLRHFGKRVEAFQKGTERPSTWRYGTLAAVQTVTVASNSTGTLRTTINGVNIDVTSTEEEIADASLIVAAVNASSDALVSGHVQAGNLAGTITLATCLAQGSINICGYTLRPVKKASLQDGDFEISGSDTADAQALVAAIKAMPGLQDLVWASNSSGVVTVISRGAAATLPINRLTATGTSGVTLSGGALAAGAVVILSALNKGIVGNTITSAVTGTGMTAGAARLAGGTSASVSYP